MWNVGRPSGQQLIKEELMSESWVRITSSVWLGVCLSLFLSSSVLTLSPEAILPLPIYSRSCPKVTLRTLLSLSQSQGWLSPRPAGERESASPSFPGLWAQAATSHSSLPFLPLALKRETGPHHPTSQGCVLSVSTQEEAAQHLRAPPYLESTAPARFSSVSPVGSLEFSSASGPEMYNLGFDSGYDLDVVFFFNVELSLIHRTRIYLVAFVWRRRKSLKAHTHQPCSLDECVHDQSIKIPAWSLSIFPAELVWLTTFLIKKQKHIFLK